MTHPFTVYLSVITVQIFTVSFVICTNSSSMNTSINQQQSAPGRNVVCNVIQPQVSEALKKLETKLENLIALVSQTITPQPKIPGMN